MIIFLLSRFRNIMAGLNASMYDNRELDLKNLSNYLIQRMGYEQEGGRNTYFLQTGLQNRLLFHLISQKCSKNKLFKPHSQSHVIVFLDLVCGPSTGPGPSSSISVKHWTLSTLLCRYINIPTRMYQKVYSGTGSYRPPHPLPPRSWYIVCNTSVMYSTEISRVYLVSSS